jgi:hypothetical protein
MNGASAVGTGLKGLSGVRPMEQHGKPKRRKRELSEAEIFEIRQLIASGVKSAKDYPEIMGALDSDEEDEEEAGDFGKREAVEEDFEVRPRSCLFHFALHSCRFEIERP